MRACSLMSVAAMMAGALTAVPALAKTVALSHFTLIDGTGRAPVRDSAMIITDGKISWVGPATKLKVPAGVAVTDLTGKFVMPGIIDSHVHLGLVDGITQDLKYYTRENVERQLRLYAAYGVTSVQVLGTDKDEIHAIVSDIRADPAGRARVWTAGRGVVFKGSYGGVAGLDAQVATPAEARAMVDREAAKGSDFIKLWVDDEFGDIAERMPPAISSAVIAEAHKDGKKAVAHIFYYDNARELTREGVNGFAHSVRDRAVDVPLLTAMKAKGVWQIAATLSREASFTYDLLPFVDDPFFSRGVTPAVIEELKSPARRQRLAAGPHFAQYPGVLKVAMENFGREAKAGIPYGMGTDSGPTARFPGYFAHWELELMVKSGITPLQALTAATSRNASFMGASGIGTIAPDKAADLLVLDKDPTADIRNTRAIDSVYLAGEQVPTIWQTCTGRAADACTGGPK
ncbi:MAG: amidohydrolase family protein [Candidatus Sphingomonas phytovorans]|nr:amidohydrolase family protein [Sphingomonas sp.]WEJ98831.1 MAG: amidohydrolase family protein [Sphingomonas sp.]